MAKQVQRRTAKSRLGFGDVVKGVEISRSLQEKILLLLEDPTESPITPSQIDAVTKYLKENGLSLSTLIKERDAMDKENGRNQIDDEDDEGNQQQEPAGTTLPFIMDEHGNSKPNPNFVSPEQAPVLKTSKRIGEDELV